jgi:hypothetical protein
MAGLDAAAATEIGLNLSSGQTKENAIKRNAAETAIASR